VIPQPLPGASALPRAFYLDASALVKRYVAEIGSAWVGALCADENTNALGIANIGIVEIAAAFAAKRRGGFIATEDYEGILSDLLRDARARYRLVPVGPALISSAIRLTRQHRLRGYDAIHLACALSLNATLTTGDAAALIFVAADANLLAAARVEGLAVENPNEHP
jgi:hypothetical protein